MSEDRTEKINRDNLPWFYRLVLKIPGTEFLERSEGVFWSIIVPIFLILESWLTLMLLVLFPFPMNIIFAAIIPTTVFIVFIRLTLERFLRWWNSAVAKSGFEWNVEKSTEEYLALLKKKEEKSD